MPDQAYRILIVDDDRDSRANLSDILTDLGYQTDTAADGEAAMEKISQGHPDELGEQYDLCLLDFRMPGMDGVELYETMVKRIPKLRAIMITAYAGTDGVRRAVVAGTWKILQKPVDISKLLSMISEASLSR